MKKLYPLLSLLFILAVTGNANAATWNIGVMNFEFTNVPATVNVGDTITWNWVNGTHTTTSIAVPTGALNWDHDMNATSTTFSYVVAVPGAYTFRCSIHTTMTGGFTAQTVSGVAVPVAGSVNVFVANGFDVLDVRYALNESANTRVALTDLSGKTFYSETRAAQSAGIHEATIETAALAKGIYLVVVQANGFRVARKVAIN